MAKMEMRVIPEPAAGTREVLSAKGAGSMAIKGVDGSISFLCGNCRDMLVKTLDPDAWIVHAYDESADEGADDEFTPLYRVRDLVFKCKGCGAFNEVQPTPRVGYAPGSMKFEVDDRVAVRGEPERCGTVKEVKEDTRDYQISWDAHAGGPLAVGTRGEEELMPCPGSHTDQRIGPEA
jgi:hypothetical protein